VTVLAFPPSLSSKYLHNKPLQTDERRVQVPAYRKLTLAPTALR
jgi:hypothetical protein